jgi:hypothetical protein
VVCWPVRREPGAATARATRRATLGRRGSGRSHWQVAASEGLEAGQRACGGEQKRCASVQAVKRAQSGSASIATKTANKRERKPTAASGREHLAGRRSAQSTAATAAIARGPTGGHGSKLRTKQTCQRATGVSDWRRRPGSCGGEMRRNAIEGCKRSIQRIGLRSWLFVGVPLTSAGVQGVQDGGRVDSARQPAWIWAGPTTTSSTHPRDPVMKCFTLCR